MTEDELDLLASAYLDGEATSEEVATVERDPELLARVEAMRAISGPLGSVAGPPPSLKEQHLAAAMAAFDSGAVDDTAESTGAAPGAAAATAAAKEADNVLDFKARGQAKDVADRTNQVRRNRFGGLPNWMPAAAVFILISGGLIALVSTSGDDDTSFDAATTELETEEAADDGDDFAQDESAEESSAMVADADSADAERAAEGDAMASDAMEDEEAMEDDEEAMEDDAMEDSAEDAEQAATTTAPVGGGLFPQEPVLFFEELPQDLLAELVDPTEPLRDVAESNCGPELTLADGVEAFGYLPVELAGLPSELFALVDQSGQESAILVDSGGCIPIE